MRLRVRTVLYELSGTTDDTGISCGTAVTSHRSKSRTFPPGMYMCTASSSDPPQDKKDIDKLKQAQQSAIRMAGAEHFSLRREAEGTELLQPGEGKA